MRPIERGACPADDSGNAVVFNDYKDARDPLIDRLGDYCSYCEIPLPSGPDVEHVVPKSLNPDKERDWENFLLGCRNCNSIKGDEDINLDDYFWPDRDNTFHAFRYLLDCAPEPADWLDENLKELAQNTICLTGLDRIPGHQRYSERDRRWLKRREAWGVADRALANLERNDTEAMREQIVQTALARGFWSVWIAVFKDDQEMQKRLLNAFRGSCNACFDENCRAVQRPGGKV